MAGDRDCDLKSRGLGTNNLTAHTIGLELIAVTHIIFSQDRINDKIDETFGYLSLRSMPTICIVCCLVPVLILFSKLRLVSLNDVFDTIDLVLIVTFASVISNIVANILSKKVTKIQDMIEIPKLNNYSDSSLENGIIFVPIKSRRHMLSEFKQFADKYDELANESNILVSKLILETKNSAVARTTQMLAHDVRKPFSMLKMALDMINNAEDPDQLRKLTKIILPEVQRSMRSVNGLIQDVMEIGSTAKPIFESTRPQTLINESISDIFRIYTKANITFHYNLKHSFAVGVESVKVLRVFSNIIGNAAQAMNMNGSLWFSTKDIAQDGIQFVEISIKNSGSFIPEKDRVNLFEAFFTKDKKGGTGLGLAIAQKIVKAHGGKIWCHSEKNEEFPSGYVEFLFTLSIGKVPDVADISLLPKNSKEISDTLKLMEFQNESIEKITENEIFHMLQKRECSVSLLIVDDEAIYCSALAAMLQNNETIGSKVKIELASGSNQALQLISTHNFDLIIMDVDMGEQSENGFDTVRTFRKTGVKSFICIHSNRTFASDHKSAIEAGAEAFLPKPMSRTNLLKLVLQSITR